MIMFDLDGYIDCSDCGNYIDDGSFVEGGKYLCHDCLDKRSDAKRMESMKPVVDVVYICRSCEELFEDEIECCDSCSSDNIEAVSKGDMGIEL